MNDVCMLGLFKTSLLLYTKNKYDVKTRELDVDLCLSMASATATLHNNLFSKMIFKRLKGFRKFFVNIFFKKDHCL